MTKYSAKRTVCAAGHTHDSRLEAGRCDDLHALQIAGQIERLTLQPEFNCSVGGRKICDYRADFAYFLITENPNESCRIVEDVKGYKTDVYRLKKKIVEAIHPGCVITEWPLKPRKKRRAARAKVAA